MISDTSHSRITGPRGLDARGAREEAECCPRFAVVVPCFNEQGAILETIASMRERLHGAGPYELIVVDDGSTDDTARMLREAAQHDSSLRVVTHSHNRGYGASLKAGILRATAEYIVITDADGTYPNERIPELVELAQDVDMVVGARTGPDVRYSLIRRIPKLFLRAFASWITRTRIPDLNSGLRVFRRDLAQRFFFLLSDGFSFTTTITLAMLTNHFAVRYVPIDYSPRVGRSKIKPIRDTLNFFYLIVRAGTFFAPMRTLFPLAPASFALFLGSLTYDVAVLQNITEKTTLLLIFSVGIFMFALLADTVSLITKKLAWEEEFEQVRRMRADEGARVVGQGGPRRVYDGELVRAAEPDVSDQRAA